MDNCIFCKIVRGEIPAERVYEVDEFIAFLDTHPRGPGHVQVIPKEHIRWVWDIPRIGRAFVIVRTIAKAQQKAFGQEMIRSQVFGDEVAHAHIWVWPNAALGETEFGNLSENAEKLRKNIIPSKL